MSSVALSEAQQAQRKKEESKAVTKAARKIKKRQSIGDDWDGKSSANNINWPLATALIREGNQELLKAAMFYRKVEAQAHSNPLIGGGGSVDMREVMIDRETRIRRNGEIVQADIRQSKASGAKVNCGTRTTKADDKTNPDDIKAPIQGAWSGDRAVNDRMDAERLYPRLEQLLGPILGPFEEMVCDGLTYEQAGRRMGVGNEAGARGAAQAVAHLGLVRVRDFAGNVSRDDLRGAL
ncbi:hypothetical protein FIU93_22750 [Labrenzia sp. THAF35]|uniref:hypothetical protein n=1 Tax=Labrenzia sp. THAF35 TaxID=2587854 RepID=UPI0012687311|nr:hypothetical protein [Labrenzia sp. THAF35]QFT69621.1 hypothetical protein FIU93_22750 [Labrenzia sp. THAF35]